MKLKKLTKVLIWFGVSVSGGALVLSTILAWQFVESMDRHWFLFGTIWYRLFIHHQDKIAIVLSIPLCIPFLSQPHWQTALLAILSFPLYFCLSYLFFILSD